MFETERWSRDAKILVRGHNPAKIYLIISTSAALRCVYEAGVVCGRLKQAQQSSVPQSKIDQAREEVEDAMAKMEQTRVRLGCC